MSRLLPMLLVAGLLLAACASEPDLAPAEADEEEAADAGNEPEEPTQPTDVADAPEPEPVDDRPRSHLTGEPVAEDVATRPQLLVKIENSPDARPQSGLEAADIVYEELVEGGITRFFTIFHSELPGRAGPVRSARPIDAQLMSGYGPSGFAYSGAREEVQGMLAGTPSITITEGAAGFARDSSRRAPHNLYLDTSAALRTVIDRGAESFTGIGWEFDDDPPGGALDCPADATGCEAPGEHIDIAMSDSYRTGWDYDADAGVYRRFQNGTPFTVTGEDRIGAANVVVIGTRHYIGPTGYPETDVVTDQGPAIVLRDGRRYEARWSKPDVHAPLVVTTPDGSSFPFKPGPTWLHMPDADAMPTLRD